MRRRVRHVDTLSKVWWFYFETPCAERKQVVRRATQALAYREKQRARERVAAAMVARDNAKKR